MSSVPWEEFAVTISSRREQRYFVEVESPAGQTRSGVPIALPWDEGELKQRLSDFRRLATSDASLREFGSQLFASVFQEDVKARYDESLGRVGEYAGGLRLRVRTEAPELAALPWELLYDPERGGYLELSQNVHIIRELRVPQPTRPMPVNLPLRVLVAIANPENAPVVMDKEHEKDLISNSLSPLQVNRMVHLEFLEHTTRETLREKVLEDFHVLHFVGHGKFEGGEGYLLLEDENGRAEQCDGKMLAIFLKRTAMRLVVLNACESARGSAEQVGERAFRGFAGVAQGLVDAGLPAVIAMQFNIVEESSRIFASAFYEGLASFQDVDHTLSGARLALFSRWGWKDPDWATPVLFLRGKSYAIFKNIPQNSGEEAPILIKVGKEQLTLIHPTFGTHTMPIVSGTISPISIEIWSSRMWISSFNLKEGEGDDDD